MSNSSLVPCTREQRMRIVTLKNVRHGQNGRKSITRRETKPIANGLKPKDIRDMHESSLTRFTRSRDREVGSEAFIKRHKARKE